MTRQLVSLQDTSKERPWASERFLRRLVAERRIPFHKIGGRVYLDLADLDAYAEAGRIEPPADPSLPIRGTAGPRRAGRTFTLDADGSRSLPRSPEFVR